MKNKKVFVDLDGVVADFVSAALALHKANHKEVLSNMLGRFCLTEALGLTTSQFWKGIEEEPFFWQNLDKTPEADLLFSILEDMFDPSQIYFLTAPSLCPQSHWGKAEWVKKHYGKYFTRLIITGHKHLLASKDTLLIDDNPSNCEKFSAAGGSTILFPRPWNALYPLCEFPLEQMLPGIRMLLAHFKYL